MIPGVIGIIVAVCVSFRLPLSVLDRVVVTIGVVACLPLLIAFGREFMTP